jgi:hypothetical protein
VWILNASFSGLTTSITSLRVPRVSRCIEKRQIEMLNHDFRVMYWVYRINTKWLMPNAYCLIPNLPMPIVQFAQYPIYQFPIHKCPMPTAQFAQYPIYQFPIHKCPMPTAQFAQYPIYQCPTTNTLFYDTFK